MELFKKNNERIDESSEKKILEELGNIVYLHESKFRDHIKGTDLNLDNYSINKFTFNKVR